MSRFEIRPVVKMPVETQATDALRDSIVTGTIAPGSRITEIRLSEEMKLSRATIRTALHQLATEGLISLVPYTGWTVVPLTSQDVWELYTLRSSLERLAAQLAAKTVDKGQSATLTRAFEALVKECGRRDRSQIAEADFALHKTIIALAGHRRLKSQYSVIEQQIRMYIRSSDALITKPSIIVDQHKPIVHAILAGDTEEAGRLSEEHNLTEGEKLSNHLRKLEAISQDTEQPTKTRQRAAYPAARA